MEFRSIRPEDYEVVREFLIEAGWEHRVGDPERFRTLIEKTDRTVVAWDDQQVVGFGRALCDGFWKSMGFTESSIAMELKK